MKTCPQCAETDLHDAALVCKHCGHTFDPPVPPDPVVADLKSSIAQKQQHRRTVTGALVIGGLLVAILAANAYWPRPTVPATNQPARLPLEATTDGMTLTLTNQSADEIRALEIAVNGGYRAQVPAITGRGTITLPLLSFATRQGARFQSLATKIQSVDVSGAIDGVRREWHGAFK